MRPAREENPYEAKIMVGLLKMYRLNQEIVVRVKYDLRKPEQVEFDGDPQSILERNP